MASKLTKEDVIQLSIKGIRGDFDDIRELIDMALISLAELKRALEAEG